MSQHSPFARAPKSNSNLGLEENYSNAYLVGHLELFDRAGTGGCLDKGDDGVAGDVVRVQDEQPDRVVAPQAVGDHRPDGVCDAAVGQAHFCHLRVASQGLEELLPLGGMNSLREDERFGVI